MWPCASYRDFPPAGPRAAYQGLFRGGARDLRRAPAWTAHYTSAAERCRGSARLSPAGARSERAPLMKIFFDFLPIILFFGVFKFADSNAEAAARYATEHLG